MLWFSLKFKISEITRQTEIKEFFEKQLTTNYISKLLKGKIMSKQQQKSRKSKKLSQIGGLECGLGHWNRTG